MTTNGAKVGSFIMFNATKILAAPADASDLICTLTWTVAKASDEWEGTFVDKTACDSAGVTVASDALTMDDKSWSFVATYANSSLSDDAAKTYSDDLIAGMKEVNVNAVITLPDADPAVAGTKQETIELSEGSSDSGAAALSAFGVALAAAYLF